MTTGTNGHCFCDAAEELKRTLGRFSFCGAIAAIQKAANCYNNLWYRLSSQVFENCFAVAAVLHESTISWRMSVEYDYIRKLSWEQEAFCDRGLFALPF